MTFHNHIQLTHMVGRTPLDELSARRRGLYLHRTTQHINTRDKHPCPQRDSNPRPQQPSGHWDRFFPHPKWLRKNLSCEEKSPKNVRFQVLTAASLKIRDFWRTASCSLIVVDL
jgi:hypothetical protein